MEALDAGRARGLVFQTAAAARAQEPLIEGIVASGANHRHRPVHLSLRRVQPSRPTETGPAHESWYALSTSVRKMRRSNIGYFLLDCEKSILCRFRRTACCQAAQHTGQCEGPWERVETGILPPGVLLAVRRTSRAEGGN